MVERFGEFELHRLIGSGGMADVWAAVGPTDLARQVCAIKVIKPHVAQDPGHRELLVREGKLAMQLRHGNLVGVFRVGEHDGRLFMAMELVDGVSLDRYLQRVRASHPGRPNLDESVYIIRMLLFALHHVHTEAVGLVNQRVVHRDVSPQNVLISSSGEVKLTDFGIARVMDGHNTSRVYGKLSYMPREQYEGSPVQQSDLFAVGAIFYELLTTQRIREHCRSRAELHEAIMNDGLPDLPEGLPPPVYETLAGLLEPDPTRRIQSALAALRLLGRHLTSGDVFLDLADLYVDCVDSRHSWYTDLTKQAQVPPDATTDEQPRPIPVGERGGRASPEDTRTSSRRSKRKKASRKANEGDPLARDSSKGDMFDADEAGVDIEAPIRGRSWESTQEHAAAAEPPSEDQQLDDLTTAPWGGRLDDDSSNEAHP